MCNSIAEAVDLFKYFVAKILKNIVLEMVFIRKVQKNND